jgi:hypothetical protein
MKNSIEGQKKLNSYLIFGVITAMLTGVAIGMQSTLASKIGSFIGSLQTGALMNLVGGGVAGLVSLALMAINGKEFFKVPPLAWGLLFRGNAGHHDCGWRIVFASARRGSSQAWSPLSLDRCWFL